MLLTTKLALNDEQRKYLESIGITQQDILAIENDQFDSIGNINSLIKALFACNKQEDAYALIRANLDKIDYQDIMSSPFMQLDREATDVYQYMYKNGIIDKQNYMYFEALSGKLNDWEEFWKTEMEGLTTIQKLDLLYNSFNNLFVSTNVNPYELGLITLTEEQDEYIFSNIEPGEKVDQIFAERPCIYVTPIRILSLLTNGNLDPNLAYKYLQIVYHMNFEMYKESDTEVFNDIMIDFWLFVVNYCNKNELDLVKLVKDMKLDSDQKIIEFINCISSIGINNDAILDVVINNILTINHPYTLFKSINNLIVTNTNKIRLSDYLDDEMMGLVVSYKLHPMFNTDDYVVKYPFPYGYPIIYNKVTRNVLMGNKVVNRDEPNLFGFVDDYLYADTVNDEIFKHFNSIEDYAEFIYATEEFRSEIMKDPEASEE